MTFLGSTNPFHCRRKCIAYPFLSCLFFKLVVYSTPGIRPLSSLRNQWPRIGKKATFLEKQNNAHF